eukprot:TRINITY_DN76928_c0_g1_i1.p1 TRINITY_DN76928_c0_g1~~TRINITY_DN76928_c0_g1_i1.p1  ORF type:complete len:118 (-),score=17.92 TRINITY_DN76928_c0_g1_i1:394-747(-)
MIVSVGARRAQTRSEDAPCSLRMENNDHADETPTAQERPLSMKPPPIDSPADGLDDDAKNDPDSSHDHDTAAREHNSRCRSMANLQQSDIVAMQKIARGSWYVAPQLKFDVKYIGRK